MEKKNRDEFLVIVEEKGSGTEHTVTLDQEYCARLTDRKIPKEELIRKSFKFLFGREPKESVLRRFNSKVIKRYFPEYEEETKASHRLEASQSSD